MEKSERILQEALQEVHQLIHVWWKVGLRGPFSSLLRDLNLSKLLTPKIFNRFELEQVINSKYPRRLVTKHKFITSCLDSGGKKLLPRTYSGNFGFDSQEKQRLLSTHASTHEPDQSPTIYGSETSVKGKKIKISLLIPRSLVNGKQWRG